MSDVQPSGTVTLVFTDVEGSTKLLEERGTDAYREALGDHRRVVRGLASLTEFDPDAFRAAAAAHGMDVVGPRLAESDPV